MLKNSFCLKYNPNIVSLYILYGVKFRKYLVFGEIIYWTLLLYFSTYVLLFDKLGHMLNQLFYETFSYPISNWISPEYFRFPPWWSLSFDEIRRFTDFIDWNSRLKNMLIICLQRLSRYKWYWKNQRLFSHTSSHSR